MNFIFHGVEKTDETVAADSENNGPDEIEQANGHQSGPAGAGAKTIIAQELEVSLHLAFVEARQQRHEFITIEHLLMALLDNASATEVLHACAADIDAMRKALSRFVEENTPTVGGSEEVDTQPTLGFQRVLQRSIMHVQSSGHGNEVTGANVLVAMFGERDSHAVYYLHRQGVTRLDVLNFIAHGIRKTDPFDEETLESATPSSDESAVDSEATSNEAPLDRPVDDLSRSGGLQSTSLTPGTPEPQPRLEDSSTADDLRPFHPATGAGFDGLEASVVQTAGIVSSTLREAERRRLQSVGIEMLLLSLLDDAQVGRLLQARQVENGELRSALNGWICENVPVSHEDSPRRIPLTAALNRVVLSSRSEGAASIAFEDPLVLLQGVFREKDSQANFCLREQGLTSRDIDDFMHGRIEPKIPPRVEWMNAVGVDLGPLCFPPDFATAWGDDEQGVWADTALTQMDAAFPATVHWRWIEHGRFDDEIAGTRKQRDNQLAAMVGTWIADCSLPTHEGDSTVRRLMDHLQSLAHDVVVDLYESDQQTSDSAKAVRAVRFCAVPRTSATT